MPNSAQVINPTLAKNIDVVIALMHSVFGDSPGYLFPYVTYTLTNPEGEAKKYILTHSLLQFVADPLIKSDAPKSRIDVIEPTYKSQGGFGCILPVVKSIIYSNGHPVFDTSGSYIVKRIFIDSNQTNNKPNKPNYSVRAAHREQYFAGQMPRLGAYYQLIKGALSFYLHMNQAPGLPLDEYVNKLNAEQFLKLACTLLEEVPKQLQQIISAGKHTGKEIVHCDLKLSNVMAEYQDNKWNVTVIDMGLAKAMQDRHYVAKAPRGNLSVFDIDMLTAKFEKKPIIYSAQTDLYAVYVMILTLAGAKHRYFNLYNEAQLNEELQHPNYTGLFNSMDLSLDSRIELSDLFMRMFSINPAEKASPDEVLSTFRTALANHKPIVLAQTIETQPATSISVTAETLKACVEAKLDQVIQENSHKKIQQEVDLFHWISKYRNLCSQTSEYEMTRFKAMLAEPDTIKIENSCIFVFIRFNLIDEYDNDACVRLLARHHEIINPIIRALDKNSRHLPLEWTLFFIRLLEDLPIQLTSEQYEYCIKIGSFISNTASIFVWNKSDTAHPVIKGVADSLKSLLLCDVKMLRDKLPAFIDLFDRQIYCINQIQKVILKYEQVFLWKAAFKGKVERWTHDLADQIIEGCILFNSIDYFFLRNMLAKQLIQMSQLSSLLKNMYTQRPELDNSPYNLKAIYQSIDAIDLADTPALRDLIQKIDTMFMMVNIHTIFSDLKHPLRKYKQLMSQYYSQFEALISNHLMDPSILVQAIQLFNNLVALEKTVDFIKKINKKGSVQSIQCALIHLMADSSVLMDLSIFLEEIPTKIHLYKLNNGLKNLLSLPATERLNQRLIAEITAYSNDPNTYIPFAATTAASSTSFGIFPAQQTTQNAPPSSEQYKFEESTSKLV